MDADADTDRGQGQGQGQGMREGPEGGFGMGMSFLPATSWAEQPPANAIASLNAISLHHIRKLTQRERERLREGGTERERARATESERK